MLTWEATVRLGFACIAAEVERRPNDTGRLSHVGSALYRGPPHTFCGDVMLNRMRSRVTVTVDQAAVRSAEEAVAAGRAASVSAWVASAMSERARRETLADVLGDIRAELGPATDEETAWARSVLGL